MTNARLGVTLTCTCDIKQMARLLTLECGISERINYLGFKSLRSGQAQQNWVLLAAMLVKKAKNLSTLVCSSITTAKRFFRSVLSSTQSH